MKKAVIGIMIAVLFVVTVSLSFGEQMKATAREFYKEIEIFVDVLSIVRMNYVTEKDPKELIKGALKGMVGSLDDYSQYMEPEGVRELREDTKGEFGGIGIEVGNRDGMLTVISPMSDTPAEKAGLQPQDIIVKINGEITKDLAVHDAVKKLRGKPGTEVTMTIWRDKEEKFFDVTLKRAVIEVDSIKKALVLEGNIGYIKLAEFQENSGAELEKSMKALSEKNIRGLIIDLRNNAGGLLNSAVDVAELFLKKGELVVSIKGRVAAQNKDYKAELDNSYTDITLVVLVNEGSASASEIFAGAMKYNKRGLLVGEKTFGKGSVQTVIPLRDGAAVRLTTALYYTPGGHSIQKTGIIPDVVVPFEKPVKPAEEAKPDVFSRLNNESAKTEAEPVIDNQLKEAMDIVKAVNTYKGIE